VKHNVNLLINLKSVYINQKSKIKYLDIFKKVKNLYVDSCCDESLKIYMGYFKNVEKLKYNNCKSIHIHEKVKILETTKCNLKSQNMHNLRKLILRKCYIDKDTLISINKSKILEHLTIDPRFDRNYIPISLKSIHIINSSIGSNHLAPLKNLQKLKLEKWSCDDLRRCPSKIISLEIFHCCNYTGKYINKFKKAKYICIKNCDNFNPKKLKINENTFFSISNCKKFNPDSIKINNKANLIVKNCENYKANFINI
jgi:hypothetical protein